MSRSPTVDGSPPFKNARLRTRDFTVVSNGGRNSTPKITVKSANRVVPFDWFLWLVLMLGGTAVVQCAAITYVAPDDCEWSFMNDSTTDVALTCRLQNVRSPPAGTGSSNSDATNFSLIQPLHTTSLNIQCEPVLFQSRLSNGSLSHLRHLKALGFEHCKFSDVPDGAFVGLSELRNLTLRTYNHEWQEGLSLQLGAQSLSRLSHLERLDLSSNNIFQLPEFLFCGLSKLKLLNLSRNSVLDGGLVGLNGVDESKGGRPCLQELRRLDLSANMIKHLKRGEFVRLHNLQALFLQRNDLAEVSEAALEGLRRLQVLDLSGNRLPELPTHFFHSTPDIRDLYLQNNSLSKLPSGVFRGLQQLLVMNLSRNSIASDSVSVELFADLIRLVILDLSHNNIGYINSSTFQSQYSLQMLYLSHNQISSIADNAFAPLYNLHTLDMSANLLKHLDVYTFNGLYVLNYLSLQRNTLETIHPDAFRNCSSVKTLLLADNKLTASPSAVSSMQFLRELDISGNKITKLSNTSFLGLKQLQRLGASDNRIGNLSRGTFRDLPSLKRLDLSRNLIQGLEHGLFDDAPEIISIDLQENLLTDINGLFMNLRSMETLNVSGNKITWFDYALIPTELKKLDLHDNSVETLGNYFELEGVLHLRWLDASNNLMGEINPVSFPNKIESILVRGNRIRIVHPFSFMSKSNLSVVDLRDNQLRNVDMNSFRLKTWPVTHQLPAFFVSGNPFFCDCTMEWLQRINDLLDETRQYPKIGDLEKTECRLPFARSRPIVPLSSANSSDFLCRYKSHCFALCHCCDFDACDCEMVCPENCTCYYDQTWNTNIVDCSSRQFSIMPHPVPMDVTHLFLDGNYLPQLTSHAFIGRKNMQVLFLNNSNIININNRTFNGLQGIKIMHLEHNKLTVLHGFEFENLSLLQEVYLSYNKIHSLSNNSFVSLRSLRVLHLDHNLIGLFQIWNLNTNTLLGDLRLGGNPWSCNCNFMEDFQEWVQSYGSGTVMDAENIRCYRDSGGTSHELEDKNAGPYLVTFSPSTCSNNTAGGATGGARGAANGNSGSAKYFPSVFNRDLVPVVIVAPCLLVIVILCSVLLCVYRKELKVWLYSKYGVRLFRKHHRYSPDSEKLFDAFVSYCKKDEAFVAQMLAPELEECVYASRGGPGGHVGGGLPSFRLCLRYRDLPVAGYVAEAIQEAIECSHRTLFVLSEQFLRSEWCRFELKTAHHEAQTNRKHRLVAVVLDKISFKDLDPDARLCLRSSTIIHWGDRRFWEKLRYAMPEGREKSSTSNGRGPGQTHRGHQRHRDMIVGAGVTGGGVVSTHCAMMMDQSSNNVKLV